MKYDHKVKFGGVLYSAGEDVPNDVKVGTENFSNMDITEDTKYTREILGTMTVKDIKKLAEGKGISITKTIKEDVISEFLSQQI